MRQNDTGGEKNTTVNKACISTTSLSKFFATLWAKKTNFLVLSNHTACIGDKELLLGFFLFVSTVLHFFDTSLLQHINVINVDMRTSVHNVWVFVGKTVNQQSCFYSCLVAM